MSGINLVHQQVSVRARVLRVGEQPWNDVVCEEMATGHKFSMDPKVGAPVVPDLKVGDVFQAVVHPVVVTFAILDWHGKESSSACNQGEKK